MRALVRSIVLALSLLAADLARAEGLVQLSFGGQVDADGGAPVELEFGLWDGKAVREVSLNIHLARETTASDLAALVASRLERAGAKVLLPREGEPLYGPIHVFVEAVTHANLRLGHGLRGSVTLCDSAPSSIRVQPPEIVRGGARLSIAATTFHHHDRRIGRKELVLELGELDTAGTVSEELARAAIAGGWVADRPSPDRWAASRTGDGAEITGCSVSLIGEGDADWRLEVQLEVPRVDR